MDRLKPVFRTKRARLIGGAALALAVAAVFALGRGSAPREVSLAREPEREYVLTVEGKTADISKRIYEAYIRLGRDRTFRGLVMYRRFQKDTYGFGDRELSDRARSSEPANSDVLNYTRLSEESRQHDLYLKNQDGIASNSWPSKEYAVDGKPAAFSSNFIVHFEPAGAFSDKTVIRVYEDDPRVIAGRNPSDARPVVPTVSDRNELSSFLNGLIMR